MDANVVDLRYRMKDVLGAIDRGETVTVLYRGKEKAKLTPIPPSREISDKSAPKTQDQPLFGLWKDREDFADPASYIRGLRKPRTVLVGPSQKQRSPRKAK